jgi:hypothetical protein
MSQSISRFLAISCALAIVLVEGAHAQSSRGSIVGNVRDPTGAAVAGAKVTVTNLDTNLSSTYETGASGDYFVPSQIPGHYSVTAEKEGFSKASVSRVTLEVNQTLRVDLPMELGAVAQQVEVAANAVMVQTDTSTLGQVVTSKELTELPLNGRDFTSLIRLNAGVTEAQGGITTASTIRRHGLNDSFHMVSINGSRPSSLSFLIDGVTANEGLFQTPTAIPPVDAIQEFQLQSALYSAEFGMGAAQVNIAMRAGTNALHGSLWEFLRNDALQAANPRFHTKTPLKQNQFGGSFGGPVVLPKIYDGRNRTFFFVSYQGGRRRIGSVGQAQVPTEQERRGDFSDWPVQLYNPLTGVSNPNGTPAVTRQPFPNNQIPATLFAPESVKLLQYLPAPNVNCALPCNNFTGAAVSSVTVDNFTVRVDHNFSANDRVSGDFLIQNEAAPSPSIIPLSGYNVTQNSRLAGLQWTHLISPRTINEARMGFNHFYFLQDFETAFGSTNYWKEIGLQNLVDNGAYYALPAVALGTQYSGVGFGGSVPFFNISNIFHWVDNLTMTRGRSTIKVGADIRRNQNMNQNGFGGNGYLSFSGVYTARNPLVPQVAGHADTGNGFADLLLGYLSGSPTARFNAYDQSFSRLRNTDFNFFFENDLRVTPQLTLNIGLRWELHTPMHDKFGGGNIFDFGYPGGRLLYVDQDYTKLVNNPILAACCAQDSLVDTDWHDWAPRIGMAWRPFRSSNAFVVRAGYGIFYDVLHSFYPAQSITKNIPALSPILPSPTGLESQPPVDIRNLFPAPFSVAQRSFPPPYCHAPASQVVDPTTGVVTQVLNQCSDARVQLPDNKTPYMQQWGANIQYQLRPSVLLELGYEGSHGLREPLAWSFNQAFLPPTAGNPNNSVSFRSQCPSGTYPNACSPIQDRVPYSNFAATATALANIGQSIHHALTFRLDKRFSNGLALLSAFTWGKTLDQSSELGGGISGSPDRAQYSHRLDLERGPAGFDQTRRLVVSWVYELPFGNGKSFANRGGFVDAIIGGWQISGIQTFAAGPPVNVFCACGDRSQTGDTRNSMRMNVTGDPTSGFTQTLTQWFDVTKFQTPALGTLGNAGRNILRAEGQRATDISLVKNARFRERLQVQLRGEAFNLFASRFYTPVFPVASATAVNFGSLLPVGGDEGNLYNPRIIQLGLRMVF